MKGPLPRPKLLFLVNVSWFFVSHRLVLAQAALGAGYEVHVATRVTHPEDRDAITKAGLILHHIEIGRGDSGVVYDLRSLFLIWRLFRELRPDLVHNVAIKPVIFGGVVAAIAGIRCVVQALPGLGSGLGEASGRARLRGFLMLRAIRLACRRRGTLVILQNVEDVKTLVEARSVSADAVVLIRGSGVDVRAIRHQPEAPGRVRVVLASRMLREKGIPEFVAAARRLREEGVPADFILAGQPDPSNPGSLTEDTLHSYAASGAVSYLGQVNDVPALFASCHIVCLPTYYREGVPKVLIEAAAAGRPVVTTDQPGCRDIVRAGENGLLVAPRDVDAIVAALRTLIASPALRKAMGAAGRERALAEFDLSIVKSQTLAVYSRLLAQPCASC